MATIKNPNAILNGYEIEFPTKGYIRSNFNINISNADEIALGTPSFLPKSKSSTTFSMIPDLLGFDVPVLIKTSCPKKKGTVVILGQDALRDPKDPLLNGINTNTDIVVGLPYAIAFDRKYKQVAIYHRLIESVLKGGYNVYLTDIWKSWDNRHISRFGKWINNFHMSCLFDEFKMEVDFILLMGKDAQTYYNSFMNIHSPEQIIIPHLSPSNNRTWKNVLGENATTQKNKFKYIVDECKKHRLNIPPVIWP